MTAHENSSITKVFLTCHQSEDEEVSVHSREYVVLILALNSKKTSHLMFVPYKNALDMSSNLVQISHNPENKSVTVKLVGRSGQTSFTAVIQDQYNLICPNIFDSNPFLIPVEYFWTVSSACSGLTSLPLVLNDPLPRHMKFLTEEAIVNARPPTPVQASEQEKSDDVREQTELSNEECPECKTLFRLDAPEDVVSFAKHYYQHFSLEHVQIPVFMQTILKLKKVQEWTQTICPLEFCKIQFLEGQTLEHHVRRRHQFEALLIHMLMKNKDYLKTGFYKSIIKLCPNLKVQTFIRNLFHSPEGGINNVKQEKIQDVSGRENSELVQEDNTQNQVKAKPTLDKSRATSLMKQFFRQHYEDRDCQSFLTSRGEVLTVKVYEKLVCFIYLVASDDEEAGQLVQFALKNLKTVEKGGREIPKESLVAFQDELNSIYYLIYGFKQRCSSLKFSPTQCDKHVLLTFLQSLVSGCVPETRATFIKWLSSVHDKVDGKPLDKHQEFKNLRHYKTDGLTLSCDTCHEEMDDVSCLLVHLGAHQEGAQVTCQGCHHSLGTLHVSDFEASMKSFHMIQNHLYSKVHLNNSRNETKIEAVENFCDACDVAMEEDGISSHFQTQSHNQNFVMIKEYLVYCRARELDPVNHSDFQAFIFFLRYIYSLSVSLELTMKQIMKVVSNIHSNFNKLLNVNESIDVTDEVISKLSATEPSMFFCFPCFEGFMTSSESGEHLMKGDCERIRCSGCKVDIEIESIEGHSHEEDSEPDENESIHIEPKKEKLYPEESMAVSSELLNSGHGEPIQGQEVSLEEHSIPENQKNIPQTIKATIPAHEKPNLEVLPAKYFNPPFHYNFDAKIPEDRSENISFGTSLPEILKNKGAPNRVKNIVDHCVEKRKADPTLLEYPLSQIRYKKLRQEAGLLLDCKEARYIEENGGEPTLEEGPADSVEETEVTTEPSIVSVTSLDIKEFKKEETSNFQEQVEKTNDLSDIDTAGLQLQYSEKDLDLDKEYKPMNFNIKMCDVAFEREWEEYLEPQIDYLKKKAEVFNRWKNDINFYKNMISSIE